MEADADKLNIKKRIKMNSLLNTAFELFTSQGINNTSISDITKNAGVAKGTFYLYFKDKYDIRNRLVSRKSNELFTAAFNSLKKAQKTAKGRAAFADVADKLVYLCDRIVNDLAADTMLLSFIRKDLSWGVFKKALVTPVAPGETNLYDSYLQMLSESGQEFRDPEVMLYMIVELVSSCCHNSILYEEPVALEQLKPYLYQSIRDIVKAHTAKA